MAWSWSTALAFAVFPAVSASFIRAAGFQDKPKPNFFPEAHDPSPKPDVAQFAFTKGGLRGQAQIALLDRPSHGEALVAASVGLASRHFTAQNKYSAMPKLPPGVLMGILGTSFILAAYAATWKWKQLFGRVREEEFGDVLGDPDAIQRVSSQRVDDSRVQKVHQSRVQQLIDNGALDYYTCVSLSLGRHEDVKDLMRSAPKLFGLVCMQIVLGVCLLAYQLVYRSHLFYSAEQSHLYRLIGFLLYVYSVSFLNRAMQDECREYIINMMLDKYVSGWYFWPALYGEVLNTLVVVMLMVILFVIYCGCTRPTDLLINCIAINFIADADNHAVTPEDIDEASDNLEVFTAHWKQSRRVSMFSMPTLADPEAGGDQIGNVQRSSMVERLQVGLLLVNKSVRLLVPMLGGILAFLFAFAHDDVLCSHMRNLEPWPFCVGVKGLD